MRKVLICGDRNWSDESTIRSWLSKLQDWGYDEVIEGGATGADSATKNIAQAMGFKVTEVKAQWSKFGRAAGPIRNAEMLKLSPQLVVAFHSDISHSKGTRNMIMQAERAGVEVILVEGG